MKSIKKLLITAGIVLQLSAGLYADSWSNAFAAFGGNANVYNNRGTMSWANAKDIAGELNTPEANAVGLYMSNGNPASLRRKFPNAASESALNAALAGAQAPVRVVEVAQNEEAPGVLDRIADAGEAVYNWGAGNAGDSVEAAPVEVAPVKKAEDSSLWDWISAAPTQPVITRADVVNAEKLQQQADVAQAAQNDAQVAAIVNSGSEGAAQLNAMVDLIFDQVQASVNAIEDPMIQQQVVNNIRQKAANMSAASGANHNKSGVLGKMNSKKASKKSRRK